MPWSNQSGGGRRGGGGPWGQGPPGGPQHQPDLEELLKRSQDAQAYLFNIQNPEVTVKEVAESAMREIVGQSNIQPILTEARQKTEQAVQKLMQDILDYYRAGIRVDQVQLQKVDPPTQVIDAFRDVQAARADQERLQNEAYAYS